MNDSENDQQANSGPDASLKTTPATAPNLSAAQQNSMVEQAVQVALQNHQAGKLSEAETIYQHILAVDPRNPFALHLLGVLAQQAGDKQRAVDLIGQALIQKPDYVDAHCHLGNVLQELGQYADAADSYRRAIALKPGYADAHNNLGSVLISLDQPNEAVISYRQAISLKPGYAEAHFNLGNGLKSLNLWEQAAASYTKAIALKPDFAAAHNNLAGVFKEQQNWPAALETIRKTLDLKPDYAEAHNSLGVLLYELNELGDAVTSFQNAIARKPGYVDAQINLGIALQQAGNDAAAFNCFRRVIALDADNHLGWQGMAQTLATLTFTSLDDDLLDDVVQLLNRPTTRPATLISAVVNLLWQVPEFKPIIENTVSSSAVTSRSWADLSQTLSAIPLFIQVLKLAHMSDLQVESLLSELRRSLLCAVTNGDLGTTGLPAAVALAVQCYINEYVIFEPDEETRDVKRLEEKIENLTNSNHPPPPLWVAALACYRPLHDYTWAKSLSEYGPGDALLGVIERQVCEPTTEKLLREHISNLTPVEDKISQAVRQQYEQNPYPRWMQTSIGVDAKPVETVLQGAPFKFDLGDYRCPQNPDVLIAGCGTGQQALWTATRFANARVLAVDLSLSSLTYAQRKTTALQVSNIAYAQADIMELGRIDKRFDLIECVGVLHHLGRPDAGWRVLVDLLRPGGIMKIALYSRAAHQCVVEGRAHVAKMGYSTSPEDIRRCRQDIIKKASAGDQQMARIICFSDFFSISECRDILFHVQHHYFTLPQIEAQMAELGLRFMGFELSDSRALANFKAQYPEPAAMSSLAHWHTYEQENPDTFREMYQFWCQKPGS